MKSGNIHTMDSYVTKQVRWPHEVVYTTHGQPPVYSDMSLALFTNGYLSVAMEESVVIKEYMTVHPLARAHGGRGDIWVESSEGLPCCLVTAHGTGPDSLGRHSQEGKVSTTADMM